MRISMGYLDASTLLRLCISQGALAGISSLTEVPEDSEPYILVFNNVKGWVYESMDYVIHGLMRDPVGQAALINVLGEKGIMFVVTPLRKYPDHVFAPGKYFVGDPVNVVKEADMSAIRGFYSDCGSYSYKGGHFFMSDTFDTVVSCTESSGKFEAKVESGLIAVIPLSLGILEEMTEDALNEVGTVLEFKSAGDVMYPENFYFYCYPCDNNGIVTVGSYEIRTKRG